LQSTGIAKRSRTQDGVERFDYPSVPLTPAAGVLAFWEAAREEEIAEDSAHDSRELQAGEEWAEKLAEETGRAFAAGRERGLLEGRQLELEEHASAVKAAEETRNEQLTKLIDQFARERDRYLKAVEKEVVKLALAVAARILRREAQSDPLLLTSAVRVALGQLAGATEVRVLVPAQELDLWKESLALLPNLALKPQVIAGEGMRLGECVMETALGSVDLGIRSQLGEIERGFFDGVSAAGMASTAAARESET